MNPRKTYTHKQVVYGFTTPKWTFRVGKYQYITALAGGVETAHKVARIISGAYDRTGAGLDNLARANINSLIARVCNNT